MAGKASVICIGAATQDVFLQGEIFKPHRDPEGMVEEFMLGSKNAVESVVFATGGGATNAAVTFARQGMKAGYLGKIGDDIAGRGVKEALRDEGVDTSLMSVSHKYSTGYSVLLLAPSGERTILTYRGASVHYDLSEKDFHSKKPDWFYVSSLDGDLDVLKEIVKYAKKNDIKIAFNPGKNELKKAGQLRQMLDDFNLLNLNKEELAMIFDGEKLEDLVVNASHSIDYVVGTDGPKGCVATDGKKLYKAGMYKDVPVVDRTGAGDAFCSGFTSQIARGEDMETAITFASANSTSVVSYIGAKTGILKENAKINKMKITVKDL